MGVPTSEVGYTSAMSRRKDHEVHKDMWGELEGGGYKNCPFPLYTTKSHSHKNFTISVLQDKFDVLEDDTSVLRREKFLKIAGSDEKPEAGISRAIYEIKPVEMPYKNVPSSQLTKKFCAVMHVFVTPALNS